MEKIIIAVDMYNLDQLTQDAEVDGWSTVDTCRTHSIQWGFLRRMVKGA